MYQSFQTILTEGRIDIALGRQLYTWIALLQAFVPEVIITSYSKMPHLILN